MIGKHCQFGNPNSFYSWGYQLNPIGEFERNADILGWIEMEECGICRINRKHSRRKENIE